MKKSIHAVLAVFTSLSLACDGEPTEELSAGAISAGSWQTNIPSIDQTYKCTGSNWDGSTSFQYQFCTHVVGRSWQTALIVYNPLSHDLNLSGTINSVYRGTNVGSSGCNGDIRNHSQRVCWSPTYNNMPSNSWVGGVAHDFYGKFYGSTKAIPLNVGFREVSSPTMGIAITK